MGASLREFAEAEGLGAPVRFLRYYKALFRSWAREAYDATLCA